MNKVAAALKAIESAVLAIAAGDTRKAFEHLDEAKDSLTDPCDQGLLHHGVYSRMQNLLGRDGPYKVSNDVTLYFLMLIEAEEIATKVEEAESFKSLERSFNAKPIGMCGEKRNGEAI